mmetsp:Transcript_6363/g.15791  ORF Transcript_6363/g.15791 Transcript_6363/m.15791 type:complete len:200 (-) Transcript_6363:632-1231(-)
MAIFSPNQIMVQLAVLGNKPLSSIVRSNPSRHATPYHAIPSHATPRQVWCDDTVQTNRLLHHPQTIQLQPAFRVLCHSRRRRPCHCNDRRSITSPPPKKQQQQQTTTRWLRTTCTLRYRRTAWKIPRPSTTRRRCPSLPPPKPPATRSWARRSRSLPIPSFASSTCSSRAWPSFSIFSEDGSPPIARGGTAVPISLPSL